MKTKQLEVNLFGVVYTVQGIDNHTFLCLAYSRIRMQLLSTTFDHIKVAEV